MAIDTPAKRRSISGVAGVPLIPGITPDASKPVAWRQQVGWSYSGIAPSPPVTSFAPIVEFVIDFTVTHTATVDFLVTHTKTYDFGESP